MRTRLDFAAFEVLADFRFETPLDGVIRFKLNSPEAMPMMISVRVVVTANSAVIDAAGPSRGRGNRKLNPARVPSLRIIMSFGIR